MMPLWQSFLPILASDAEKVINLLLDLLAVSGPLVQLPATPREQLLGNSEISSSQSSPFSGNHYQPNGSSSSGNEASQVSSSSGSASQVTDDATSASSRGSMMMNGGRILWKSVVDQLQNFLSMMEVELC